MINPITKPAIRKVGRLPEKEKLDCGDGGDELFDGSLTSTIFPNHTSLLTAFFRGFFFNLLR